MQNIVKDLQASIQAEKSVITAKNKNLQQKHRAKDKLVEQNNEHELEIKKMEYELKKAQDEYNMMKGRVKKCL